jgi:hypothetical protein
MKLGMLALTIGILSFGGFSVAAFGDHCASQQQIMRAAHRLDETADNFHELIHDRTGYGRLASYVHELGEEATAFHEFVEAGASCDEIAERFHNLSNIYLRVRRLLRDTNNNRHDTQILRSWSGVARSYEGVRNTLPW